jgi:hypothetical protein
MKTNLKTKFKYLYLAGWLLLFTSLFLEWYLFQVYSGNKLLASWNYSFFTEWTTLISGGNSFNTRMRPSNLMVPFPITLLFIGVLFVSGYSVLFKDLETQELNKLSNYAYVNLCLLALNIYYIFVFPLFYLMPQKLYFPYLLVKDPHSELTYFYSIGPGYVLHILGFILVFPYAIFYYQTVKRFESKANTPENLVQNYLRQVQEPLDLDELIAKEQVKLKFKNSSVNEPPVTLYNENLKKKRRKRK